MNHLPLQTAIAKTPAPNDGVIRILIVGQSNGESPAQGVPDAYSVTGMVKVSLPDSPDFLVVPSSSAPVHKSVSWVYLGDALASNFHMPVEIYNAAVANTTTTRWRNGLYLRAITELKAHRFDAVLWVQGESDYGNNVATQDGYDNLKFVIQQCQGNQFVPWYVALDTTLTELNKPWLGTNDRVLNAQRQIIREGIANQGPDLMPLHQEAFGFDGSGAEFIGPTLQEHADLWFATLSREQPWRD